MAKEWTETNSEEFKERMDSWLTRVRIAVEERERKNPGEMERINRQLGFDMEHVADQRAIAIMQEGKFSEHHLKIIQGLGDEPFDAGNPIVEKIRIFSGEFSTTTKPWMFMASRSGSGKTTAIHNMVWEMVKNKKIVAPGYIVHSDFIEAVFGKKEKIEFLYKYDFLVIDDFFKKAFEGGSLREQDVIKKLVDYFYRFRKGLVICSDVPMDDIHDRLDKDEYADQICYRILEKAGYKKDRRFVYGFNDLPNLRKNKEE